MAKRGNPKWKRGGISPNPGGRSRELAQLQNAARLEAASHASEVIGYLLKVLRSEEEGTAYRLKAASSNDSADNVNATYTVNASSEVANGAWKLNVQDVAAQDTGYINGWKLTFP